MKQSIFRRTLLLFLCAALLMSLFGAAFAAENTQTQFFYFSASKESGVIVPPEKVLYRPEATVRQVLLASGHIFKGLEQGWVEQIDGVDGNLTAVTKTAAMIWTRVRPLCGISASMKASSL